MIGIVSRAKTLRLLLKRFRDQPGERERFSKKRSGGRGTALQLGGACGRSGSSIREPVEGTNEAPEGAER